MAMTGFVFNHRGEEIGRSNNPNVVQAQAPRTKQVTLATHLPCQVLGREAGGMFEGTTTTGHRWQSSVFTASMSSTNEAEASFVGDLNYSYDYEVDSDASECSNMDLKVLVEDASEVSGADSYGYTVSPVRLRRPGGPEPTAVLAALWLQLRQNNPIGGRAAADECSRS
eukprot:16408-Amphidinium_carterae.3